MMPLNLHVNQNSDYDMMVRHVCKKNEESFSSANQVVCLQLFNPEVTMESFIFLTRKQKNVLDSNVNSIRQRINC